MELRILDCIADRHHLCAVGLREGDWMHSAWATAVGLGGLQLLAHKSRRAAASQTHGQVPYQRFAKCKKIFRAELFDRRVEQLSAP